MSNEIAFIPLSERHKSQSGAESNAIMVTVSYWKGSGVVLGITGVDHQPEPNYPNHFSYMPIGSPSVNHTLEKVNRDPGKKKMPGIVANVAAQVEGKTGTVWQYITEFATKHGMKIG